MHSPPRSADGNSSGSSVGKFILIICLVISLLANITQYQSTHQSESSILSFATAIHGGGDTRDPKQRKPKLGDGCRHVFLDVGSNIGVHSRILFEPSMYPIKNNTNSIAANSGVAKFSARNFFEEEFGLEDDRVNTEICIFAFEPNPKHIQRQRELEKVYSNMGWRYHFLPVGVSDVDSEITFYHIGKGNKQLERGFTMIKERCNRKCEPERVKVYRLSDWINNEIHDRIIPENNRAIDKTIAPRVIMKMDVEMGEWILLPDLISSGILCQSIDTLLGEFHTYTHRRDFPMHFPNNNFTLKTHLEAGILKRQMMKMIEHNMICSTKIVEADDESYELDGIPYPDGTEDSSWVNY